MKMTKIAHLHSHAHRADLRLRDPRFTARHPKSTTVSLRTAAFLAAVQGATELVQAGWTVTVDGTPFTPDTNTETE